MFAKIYSAVIGIQMALAMYSVVQSIRSPNPATYILWFCVFAILVAVLYWIRDGHKYKPYKGEPRYYLRNKA